MIMRLAAQSLRNRLLTSILTTFSIALSVALLLAVEQVRTGVRESFSSTICGTDLIVGTRVGRLQLVLFTVFGIGATPDNIDYETFERYQKHPAVDWAVPFSLGDSHRGFRVIATDAGYFEHMRFHQDRSIDFVAGQAPKGLYDAVIGYKVAKDLGYRVGTEIVVSHGISARPGISDHDEHPFTVTGVLDRTATPIDHAVYITLAGMEAIHGAQHADDPADGNTRGPDDAGEAEPRITSITAFFLGLRSPIDTMRLRREINTDEREPLLAIIPGVALSALWKGIDMTDSGLKAISAMVVLVGLIGMLVSLLGNPSRETARNGDSQSGWRTAEPGRASLALGGGGAHLFRAAGGSVYQLRSIGVCSAAPGKCVWPGSPDQTTFHPRVGLPGRGLVGRCSDGLGACAECIQARTLRWPEHSGLNTGEAARSEPRSGPFTYAFVG